MALDPLEKQRLREKMALRMKAFTGVTPSVTCLASHWVETPHVCELCLEAHSNEVMSLKNRGGKKMVAAVPCIKEMVRFQVVDVEDLEKWIARLPELKAEALKRIEEQNRLREEERRRLERKVIVRKRSPSIPK